MIQDVAVVNKSSCDVRIAEVHTNLDAGIGALSIPEGNVVSVLHRRVLKRHAINRQDQKMDLVHMEGVFFAGVILDRPVFDCAYLGGDCRWFIFDEESRLLAFNRDEEINWGICTQRRF